MTDRVRCYIGLGANLADPEQQLRRALERLAGLPDCHLLTHSSLYLSPPMGPQDQPDYLNMVAALDTRLMAESLLDALQAIESVHLRRRARHWGPRTLDLDLLLYGDQRIDLARLQVPHPGIRERAFVLVPLAEIADERLEIPGLGFLRDLLPAVANQPLTRILSTQHLTHLSIE